MTNLPDRPSRGELERRLSNRDFERVIRRAAELQARDSDRVGEEGIGEAELLRIGKELGLSAAHLQRALAEISSAEGEPSGILNRLLGPSTIRVGRAISGEAPGVARILEPYLVEREYLVVLRRFPERVLFTRATGVGAALGRAAYQVFGRSPLLRVANLEMAVHPLDDGQAYVQLATSLDSPRTVTAATAFIVGGSASAFVAAALAIAIAPPAALLALPLFGGAWYGGQQYYASLVRSVEVQLESLLDRLQHGELPPPGRWSMQIR